MAEQTKADLEAEIARLTKDNENLRGQLAAAGARPPAAQHQFLLSEGQRQELALNGNVLVNGQYLTADQVVSKLGPDQQGLELDVPDKARELPREVTRDKVAGIDYVYPSVAYGQVDPAVAGQPGVHGPAATTKR
jgi:hypothetical protein